jgi:hypothetical protein
MMDRHADHVGLDPTYQSTDQSHVPGRRRRLQKAFRDVSCEGAIPMIIEKAGK